MKKFSALILALIIATGFLTACGDVNGNNQAANSTVAATSQVKTEEPAEKPKEPIALKLSIWGNDAHKAMYEDLLAKYKQNNPHVSTEIVIIPYADYQQKLSVMKAANEQPDVCWLADRMIPQFLENDMLSDIMALQDDKEYDFQDIYPSTLDLLTKDGKYYGIPFSTPVNMIYYNKTLFTEKGVKTPMDLYKEGKWNFEEMLNTAKELTDKSKGIYGIKLVNDWKNSTDGTLDLIWGFGGDIFGKDGSLVMNSPENEAALNFLVDMVFKEGVHPKPGDQVSFESGKVAMFRSMPSYFGTAKNIKDFEWDLAPWPEGPKTDAIVMGFAGYAIFKNNDANRTAESLALLKYLTSKESMAVSSQFFVPSRKSVLESEDYIKTAPVSAESFRTSMINQMSRGRIPPGNKNWADIDSEIIIALDSIYTQTITVKDALDHLEAKAGPLAK